MPYRTYQIAFKLDGEWHREYVCAKDTEDAINTLIVERPQMTMDDFLSLFVQSEDFQVEACA